jgi:hypothetical protein
VTDAHDFLMGGGRCAGAASGADPDAFLMDDSPDQPEPGRWFTSRYDGSCSTCFADYGEGEEIRADGEGGWQARECCGYLEEDDITPEMVEAAQRVTASGDVPDDVLAAAEELLREADRREAARAERAAKAAARPKAVEMKVPIIGGRYVMRHPTEVVTRGRDKGKPKRYSGQRMTTFVKLAADSFKLTQWQLRSAIVGLTKDDSLREEVAALIEGAEDLRALVKAESKALNALADKAKDASGGGERARNGTILHKYTEELDAGTRRIEDVPEEYQRDAAVYVEALKRYGYEPVPGLIERTTTVVELGVVGTFDRVLRRVSDGAYVIGDVKSGSNALTYSQLEIAAQLAGYAWGFNEIGVAQCDEGANHTEWESWGWVRPVDADGNPITVRTDFAVVMHIPFGSGECELYRVDLEEGRRELAACALVRERHKVKGALTPLELPGNAEPVAIVPVTQSQPEPEPAQPVTDLEHSGDMRAVVAQEVSRQRESSWEERFAAVRSREEASALYQLARADVQELGLPRLQELVRIGLAALQTAA